MRIIKNYKEDIYGNLATVYHRTNFNDLINAVYTEGFKPGDGDMYGKGFYGTYDLSSQERQNMKDSYGSIVVKFAVSIEHFFIFDYSEFIKSPNYKKLKSTKETFIDDQAKYFKIRGDFSYVDIDAEFTSDNARIFVYNSDITRKVKGIIFTGRRDGCTLVAYDTRLVIPLAYRIDGERSFTKVDLNKEYFKKSLQQKFSPIDVPKSEFPEWIKNAKIKYAEIDFNEKLKVWIWRGGIWLSGVWEDGIWEDGEWKNGEWKNGHWDKGIWRGGIWHQGRFTRGDWLDGIWKKGVWEWGDWKKGVWESGLWLGGNWWGGTWLKGNWEKGSWMGGVWKGGNWSDGYWMRGIWEDGIWTKGIWTGGTWNGGTWYGGTWNGGIWKRGRIFDREKADFVESIVDPKTYFEQKKVR